MQSNPSIPQPGLTRVALVAECAGIDPEFLTPDFLIDNDIVPEMPLTDMRSKVRAASRSVYCSKGLEFRASKKFVSVSSGLPSKSSIPDDDLPALLASILAHLPGVSSSGIKVKPESSFVSVNPQDVGLPVLLDEPGDRLSKVAVWMFKDIARFNYRVSAPAWLKQARKHDISHTHLYLVSATFRHRFDKPLAYDTNAAALMKRFYKQDLNKFYKRLDIFPIAVFKPPKAILHYKNIVDNQKKELLEDLAAIDEYAEEMGIEKPRPQLQAAVREMVLKLWKARPEDYSVSPRADGSISISASVGMNHSLSILCRSDHSVACFLSRDGHNSQAHYDTIQSMPYSYLLEAMAPFQKNPKPQRTKS